MPETTRAYLRFRVGNQWYGIDVDHVIEVLNFMMLTEIPGAAPDLLGMMTLRDMVIPVTDLRLRFGLSDVELAVDTPVIAVNTDHNPMGLVVDDVDDLATINTDQIASYQGNDSPYVTQVARLDDGLLLLLDLSLLSMKTA